MTKKKIIIIGNGIAGTTVALELAKRSRDLDITMISGESTYHYSRPALMYIFMGHMRYQDTMPYPKSFWNKQNITLKKAWVTEIDSTHKTITCDDHKTLQYDKLILATGSISNKFGWPGQDLKGVQGLYNLQDLETLEAEAKNAKNAVIVGGGLIGIELAEMLHQRGIKTTFLVREKSYWNRILLDQESAVINDVITKEDINLILSTNLKEIVDNGSGHCKSVVTEFDEEIPADIVGLTAGVSPNISLAKESGIACKRGILVDTFFETQTTDIFSIGDCAEICYSEEKSGIDQLWYTGKMQGEQLAQNLLGEKTPYTKPIFYNSAKFFDLEYQIYGDVFRDRDGEKHLYWEDKTKRHIIRLIAKDGKFVGINSLGIRYRQKTCHEWIANNISIEDAIKKLPEANFDPEFYKKHEKEMIPTLQRQL